MGIKMTDDTAGRKRTRAGGRAGNKTRAGSAAIDQMPWRIPVNPDHVEDRETLWQKYRRLQAQAARS